jgi:hypothetical protein
MLSDRNPFLAAVPYAAQFARAYRQPRGDENFGRKVERLHAAFVSAALDLYRDVRDASREAAFYQVYGNMLSLQMADQRAVMRRQTRFDPRAVPAVRQVLDEIDRGGLPEAVVRAGMLVVKAGGGKRRLSQMETTRDLIAPTGILGEMSEDEMRRLLHEETIVVEFEPREAKRSLPRLARTAADRRKLHVLFDTLETGGALDERQRDVIGDMRRLLPLPRVTGDGAPRAKAASRARSGRPPRGRQAATAATSERSR